MKILLRRWDEKYYVWKESTWKNGKYYVDGAEVMQVNILAIEADERGKYVQCAHCGEIMVDDPAVIEKHFADQEAKRDCLHCNYMRRYNTKDSTIEYTPKEDGTYDIVQKYNSELRCNLTWTTHDINSAAAKKDCIYGYCRRRGVKAVSDIFMQYPGLFDKQITVDMLKQKGFEYEKHNRHGFIYDMKLRGTLKACVNELGIVDHFIIQYKYESFDVYYSDKYGELFYRNRNNAYTKDIPGHVSQSKHDAVKSKISALYKEASK